LSASRKRGGLKKVLLTQVRSKGPNGMVRPGRIRTLGGDCLHDSPTQKSTNQKGKNGGRALDLKPREERGKEGRGGRGKPFLGQIREKGG